MNTVFIYALNCPISGRTRYVGKAKDPYARYGFHLDNNYREGSHKANWIRSVLATGENPRLEILDEVPESEWQLWEREWIKLYRMLGFHLTNLTDGGDGRTGDRHSEETRAKMSASRMGKKHSLEARAKMSASRFGKPKSLEHCVNIGLARRGKKRSLETCLKMSVSGKGKKRSAETCARIRQSKLGNKNNLGNKRSLETRLKMSESMKKYHENQKEKNQEKVNREEILMRGAYFQYMKEKGCVPDATAEVKARHAEECELRLARIANGAEPGYEKPKHKTVLATK